MEYSKTVIRNEVDKVIVEMSRAAVRTIRDTEGSCLRDPAFAENIKALERLYFTVQT